MNLIASRILYFFMEKGDSKTTHNFIGPFINVTQNAPTFLCRRQKNDGVATLERSASIKVK